jgi:hypothetical protein
MDSMDIAGITQKLQARIQRFRAANNKSSQRLASSVSDSGHCISFKLGCKEYENTYIFGLIEPTHEVTHPAVVKSTAIALA